MQTNPDLAALSEAATKGELYAMGWGDGSTQMGMTNLFNDDAAVCLMECIPEADAKFIAALWNTYRSGDLVLIEREGMLASKVSELAWAAEMLCRGVKFECSLGVASATETGLCCGHCDQTNAQCYQIGRVKTALKPFLFADAAIAAILGEHP